MKNFIINLINTIFNVQEKFLSSKYKNSNILGYSDNSMIKNHIAQGATLTLSVNLEKNRKKVENDVENLAKENIYHIENILNFAIEKGVECYFISNAEKLLKPINEECGLIFPEKGIKALYLNLISNGSFSFNSDLKFIFDKNSNSPYTILYNFYKWYSLYLNLPGFDKETLSKFKHIEDFEQPQNVEKLTYKEIMDLKQAIARDREAMEFVVNFMKKIEGSKNAFSGMITKDNGASL